MYYHINRKLKKEYLPNSIKPSRLPRIWNLASLNRTYTSSAQSEDGKYSNSSSLRWAKNLTGRG